MKKLNLNEAPKTVAFTFGRFNPPTTGHEKLCDAVRKANPSDYKIFVSHKQDPKTDPLQYAKKIAYMKQSFSKHKKNIIVSKSRNIFEILVELNSYENLIMVVGSDRVAEFKRIINEYNGVKSRHGFYEYKTVKVLSAGERDPDAEGVAGMSASKMRAAAADSDFDSFKLGTPLNDTQAKKLYFDVRKSMGIREELDLSDLDTLRDLYLSEQIWNVGELIKVKGSKDYSYPTWEIIRRGTNYVTVIDESYNPRKIWLHDIEIDDVASRLDGSRVYPKVDESWFDDLVSKIKSKTIRKSNYEYAKEILQSVIDRKKRDKTLKHNKLYYAQRIGDQIPGVDYRMLAKMVKEENVKQDPDIKDIEDKDTIIEASIKTGIPYNIVKKIYHKEELTEREINMAMEEFKFYPDNLKEYIQIPPPPTDDVKEMEIVRKFISERTKQDEEDVANNDEDSFYSIKEYCKKNGLKFHEDELDEIVNQSIPTIRHFKNKFNRKRPFEIDGNLDVLVSKTNKTRAYPSGHSCQSMIIALYVASKFPDHSGGIFKAATVIGISRVKAGFHYLSDHVAGVMLGQKMYEQMNKEDYGKSLNEYWLMGTPEYMRYLKKLTPGEDKNDWDEIEEDAEYAGRRVKLNNPTKGDTKKYKVYVRNDKGNVVKVEFGDPDMEIKRDDPKRLKSFRARHGCDKDPGPKWKAKYWSCKFWEKGKTVTDLMKG